MNAEELQFFEEIVEWFGVKFCELKKLDNVHPAFSRLTLGEKRMCHTQFRGNIALRQFGFLAGFD
jgi:hypothetical protein